MWRVVFRDPYDRVANRQPNCVWHPTHARAQYWAEVFAHYGFAVAVEGSGSKTSDSLRPEAEGRAGWDDR